MINLIEQLQRVQVDKDAFEPIDTMYRKPLLTAAIRLTRDPCAAEDLVQETMLRAFLELRRGTVTAKTPGRFFAWLLRVARSIWLDERKADYLRRQRERIAAKSFQRSVWAPAREPDPLEVLDAPGLSPRQREAARRYYTDHESYAAIAASLDVSTTTIWRDIQKVNSLAAGKEHA